jgi:hypothetical protein
MSLNLPANPSPGDRTVIGTTTYEWDGTSWNIVVFNSVNVSIVTATDQIIVTTTTNSTSTLSGGLVVTGGAGIGGDINVGGQIFLSGNVAISTASFAEGTDISIQLNTTTNVLTISNISTLDSVALRGAITTSSIQITNTSSSTSTNTGALIVSGGVGIQENLWVEGRVTSESVKIKDSVFDSTLISVNTTDTVVIDQYSLDQFRSAKYLIQIDEGTGPGADHQVIEIILLADNAGTVYATEYGLITTNGEMGDFSADVDLSNIVRLYLTPYFATNKEVVVLRIGMAV